MQDLSLLTGLANALPDATFAEIERLAAQDETPPAASVRQVASGKPRIALARDLFSANKLGTDVREHLSQMWANSFSSSY